MTTGTHPAKVWNVDLSLQSAQLTGRSAHRNSTQVEPSFSESRNGGRNSAQPVRSSSEYRKVAESVKLAELEQVIERGLQTFVEVGRALREISEGKLYRESGYATFEDYCEGRWKRSREWGYKFIQAYEVSENVHTCAHSGLTVSQARELSVLEPEQQREVVSGLDLADTTIRDWLSRIDKDSKEARNKRIFELWLACYTQEEIAEAVGVSQAEVAKSIPNGDIAEQNKPAALHQADFDVPLYNGWKQQEKTASSGHFLIFLPLRPSLFAVMTQPIPENSPA